MYDLHIFNKKISNLYCIIIQQIMFHVKVCNILLHPFQKDPLSRKKIVSKGYIF